MGEKAKGRSLLVAPHLLTDNLGIHEQPGKHLAKLHVVGALAASTPQSRGDQGP